MDDNEKRELEGLLPRGMDKQGFVEKLERICDGDEEIAERIRENALGYMTVIKEGKFKITDYLNAVKYCTFKLAGNTNRYCYLMTFPEKRERFVDEFGSVKEDIDQYASIYNSGKLVRLILDRAKIPVNLLYMDLYHEALNVQADLMRTARSEKVRSDAAGKVMDALKGPENVKMEVEVGVKEDSSIKELREVTRELAKQQREMLDSGKLTAVDIAEAKLIEGEVLEE